MIDKSWVVSIMSGLGLMSAAYAAPSATLEVVQSVPLETTLAVPGIRFTQEVWLELIQSAKIQIDLEQFYISEQAGEGLTQVLQAIRDAAARGVRVRVLVDLKFFGTYPETVRELATHSGIEARTVDFAATNGVQHAKFFIVDGIHGFIGSQNFDWRAINQIHEIGIKVTDDGIAKSMTTVFNGDWARGQAVGESKMRSLPDLEFGTSHHSALSLVASPASLNPDGVGASLDAVLSMLALAETSVKIMLMEYTSKVYDGQTKWTVLNDAIKRAADRGVKVQLLVDATNLAKGKSDLKFLAALKNIEVKVVSVPEWSGGKIPYARLIHSKFMVVDGAASWVGSENWSQGYFMGSRNLGLVLQSKDIATQLSEVFMRAWASHYARAFSDIQ